MKTVVLASCTPEEEAMLAERHRLDQDRRDEVWQGEYHLNPGPHFRHGRIDDEIGHLLHEPSRRAGLRGATTFNIGEPTDYRVPDRGYVRKDQRAGTFLPTAAIVVEVVSPGDESWLKFDFYAAHAVDEVVIVDGDTHTIHWFVLRDGTYEPVDHSPLLALDVQEVTEAVDWP
jgi:Uma2 family endonuclease